MDGPSGSEDLPVFAYVRVGEIGTKEDVVLLYGRTEQKRTLHSKAKRPAGEVAGSLMIEALLSPAYRLQVAIAIEDREGVAMLKHPNAVVHDRGGRRNIKLVFNANDLF